MNTLSEYYDKEEEQRKRRLSVIFVGFGKGFVG